MENNYHDYDPDRIAEGKIEVSTISNLKVKISVISSFSQGESIIVLFIDKLDNKVKYSMVIDYYAINGAANHITSLLNNYEVSTIDLLCWTHPHADHTRGLDSFMTYCGDTTKIIVPSHYYSKEIMKDLLKKESNVTNKIYNDAISSKFVDSDNIKNKESNGDTGSKFEIDLKFMDEQSCRKSDLIILTPNTNVVKTDLAQNKMGDINSLSLSFVLSIDGYMFYFGGDTYDDHIKKIKPGILEQVKWAKIPHHCSTGAQSLSSMMKNLEIAVGTVFKPQNLPNSHVCDMYYMRGNKHFNGLYLTGKKNNTWDKKDNPHDFGILHFDYNFSEEEVTLSISGEGNAHKYKFKSIN